MNRDGRTDSSASKTGGRRTAVALTLLLAAFGSQQLDSLSDRRTRVEQMNADQKEQLWRRYERFRALPPAEQARIRSLNAELAQDRDAAELQQVIQRYQHWLEGISAAERAELISLEPEQRLKRISELREEERRRLGPEDAQALAVWLESRLMKYFPERRADFAALPENERRERVRAMLAQNLVRQPPRPPGAQAANTRKRPFNPADVDELREALSPRAREQLDKAAKPDERRQLVLAWIRQVYFRGPSGAGLKEPRIGEERLRKFFDEELSVSQRVELLRLPADQMQRQLRRMYHNRHPTAKEKRGASASAKRGDK
jgi:hypothetical protein